MNRHVPLNPDRGDRTDLLTEDFEVWPPAGWTIATPVGTSWIQSTSGNGHTGNYSAFHNDDFGQSNAYIYSPALDFTGSYGAFSLTYWEYVNYSSWAENQQVVVSTDGVNWDIVNATIGPEDTWQEVTIDLSAYAGQSTVYVGFYYTGDFASEWWIDDVVVAGLDPSIEGYVLNGTGQTIAGATVEITSLGRTATTDATGYYQFFGIADGTYDMVASRTGYNTSDPVAVTVTAPAVTYQEFTLLHPEITVSPLIFDETLHPNEYLTTYLGLLNTGDGPVNWAASIIFPGPPPTNPDMIQKEQPDFAQMQFVEGPLAEPLSCKPPYTLYGYCIS